MLFRCLVCGCDLFDVSKTEAHGNQTGEPCGGEFVPVEVAVLTAETERLTALVDSLRATIAEHERVTARAMELVTVMTRLRALTGATADGDVVPLVERLRARAEGRADARVAESEVEAKAWELFKADPATRRMIYTDFDPAHPNDQTKRLREMEAHVLARWFLADRDARRKAGGGA